MVTLDGGDGNWLRLDITSKDKEVPIANISTSNTKYCTIAVPFSLFSDTWDNNLQINSFYCQDLDETTTLMHRGTQWHLTQSWGDDSSTIVLSHRHMVSLLRHCSQTLKTRRYLAKVFKPKPLSRITNNLKYLYNLPRKLVKW